MVINNRYNFNDVVYLRTDEDQKQRIVTGMRVTPSGEIIYMLACGSVCSDHYDFEMCIEKNVLVSSN